MIDSLTLHFVLPEIIVGTMICVILLAVALFDSTHKFLAYGLTQLTYGVSGVALILAMEDGSHILLSGTFIKDPFADIAKLFTLLFAALSALYAQTHLQTHQNEKGEFYVLSLFAVLGSMVVISANSLLTLYIGIELLSLSLYVMIAWDRKSNLATEAAVKFFVLSALATGILLYGCSLIYGATGSLNLDEIRQITLIEKDFEYLLLAAVILTLVGAAFKMALTPFHFWIPDVYQGGNLASVTFMGSVPKLAGLAIFIRLFAQGLSSYVEQWQSLLLILALLSIVFGNVVALSQSNFRRMLAYSSIGHMGFVVLAVACASTLGYSYALFYTISYALTAVGIFGLLVELDRRGVGTHEVVDLKGLQHRHKFLSFLLLILLFSMAGIPPLLGFYAKFSVIVQVLNVGWVVPAIVAVVATVIAAYYYLRVIRMMYFEEVDSEQASPVCACDPFQIRVAVWVNALAVLALGLFAQPLLDWCLAVFCLICESSLQY